MLRFVRDAPCALAPILVTVKIVPMMSATEISCSSRVQFDDSPALEKKIYLTNPGEYADVSLLPRYIKEKGVKKPCCRVVISIDGNKMKQWMVTVYNPHYGSRLKRDSSNKGMFFSRTKMGWVASQMVLPKIALNHRAIVSDYSDSKECIKGLPIPDCDWEALFQQLDDVPNDVSWSLDPISCNK